MNLSRSRNRTREPARSPAISNENRPFLPPSHYAAAAGSPRTPTFASVPVDKYPIQSTQAQPQVHHQPGDEYEEDRSRRVSRRMSMAPSAARNAENRKSQAKQLDFMESQLLPSLNDTIGRMTQTQTQYHPPSPSSQPVEFIYDRDRHPTTSDANSHLSTPRSASRNTHTISSDHQRARTNPPHQSPAPATATAPSPALTHTVRRAKSSITPSAPSHAPDSEASRGNHPGRVKRQQLETPTSVRSIPRPRANSSGAPLHDTPTPASAMPITPDSLGRKSHIARRQALSKAQLDSPSVRNKTRGERSFMHRRATGEDESSASELEASMDLLGRQKSRLFVANASTPSSSEAEVDLKGRISDEGSRLPTLASRRPRPQASNDRKLGLGINVPVTPTQPRAADVRSPRAPRITQGASAVGSESSSLTLVSVHEDGRPATHYVEPEPDIVPEPHFPALSRTQAKEAPLSLHDMLQRKRHTRLQDNASAPQSPRQQQSPMDTGSHHTPKLSGTTYQEDIPAPTTPHVEDEASTWPASRHERRNSRESMASLHSPRNADNGIRTDQPMLDGEYHANHNHSWETPLPAPSTTSHATRTQEGSTSTTPGVSQTNQTAKSPGRQAINRQSIVNLPSSLRRYSVYGNSPSLESTPTVFVPHDSLENHFQPSFVPPLEPAVKSSPPLFLRNDDHNDLPAADSDLSVYSSSSIRWGHGDESFSSGAEALFRRIHNSPPLQHNQHTSTTSFRPSPTPTHQQKNPTRDTYENAIISPATSASSYYDEERSPKLDTHDDISQLAKDSDEPHHLHPSQTEPQMTNSVPTPKEDRLILAQDMLTLQTTYIERLQIALDLFITPLRTDNAHAWLPGVPTNLGRLFSWFEDIVILHSHIAGALQTLIDDEHASSSRIGHVLREFVPRFEVYQPYLVRASSVVQTLKEMLVEDDNEFAEYVRIQEEQDDSQNLNLADLLLVPVGHLPICMEMFKSLLAATPRDHPDFMATFSLVHSASMILHVMDEVKAREEEYDTIKMVSTRLHGLPFADKLARRERRLLIRGEVECVTPGMTSAYVFVFTDVLLIAQAFEDEGESWWCHDERQGVARLLEVVHIGSADTFTCHFAPISLDDAENGVVSPTSSVSTLDLRFPAETTGEDRSGWLRALQACSLHTVRSLSFPTNSGRYLAHGPSVDLETDTKNSVLAILASGLPFPKSPSIHIEEASQGKAANDQAMEREERGWWALRFQQIMREMQRQAGM